MTFDYVSVEQAIEMRGLRMVVVGGVPSPWGEAAKGILYVKRIEWAAVRLVYDSERLVDWAGEPGGPVAIYDDEPPRSNWAEILLLAERLASTPQLIPEDPEDRALMFGWAHELMGQAGLAWSRRLQLVHAGLQDDGGFPESVAGYLAGKYGYRPELGASSGKRVAQLLDMLTSRLKTQRAAGSSYYLGDSLTALDIYAAACMALFSPLPPEHCDMHPRSRAAFETRDARTQAALDPVLIEHRDRMYEKHLQLPLSL